jgi:hypothetical protein
MQKTTIILMLFYLLNACVSTYIEESTTKKREFEETSLPDFSRYMPSNQGGIRQQDDQMLHTKDLSFRSFDQSSLDSLLSIQDQSMEISIDMTNAVPDVSMINCHRPSEEICNLVDDDCDGITDENIQIQGAWSSCQFSDECDENGNKERMNQICVQGMMNPMVEYEACQRVTEGIILTQENWGSCQYDNACDEQGLKSREQILCQNGRQTRNVENQNCSRNTEGAVISTGNWGACQYANACIELGLRSRNKTICKNGASTVEPENEYCGLRETDGIVIDYGVWGSCGSFSSICDESGTKRRVNVVCVDSALTNQTQESPCSVNLDEVKPCGDNRCCRSGSCTQPDCRL